LPNFPCSNFCLMFKSSLPVSIVCVSWLGLSEQSPALVKWISALVTLQPASASAR